MPQLLIAETVSNHFTIDSGKITSSIYIYMLINRILEETKHMKNTYFDKLVFWVSIIAFIFMFALDVLIVNTDSPTIIASIVSVCLLMLWFSFLIWSFVNFIILLRKNEYNQVRKSILILISLAPSLFLIFIFL